MNKNTLLAVVGISVIGLIVIAAISLKPNQLTTNEVVTQAPVPAKAVIVDPYQWTQQQKELLATLSLKSLPPLPPDPSNAAADNPAAAQFGHKLFFDKRFSSNGEVSCSTCHKPELIFTDGLARAKGVGVTPRKAMTLVGVAYSKWFFWDGRKDSMWSQALGPTESAVEHGGNRTQYAHIIDNDADYHAAYETLFGKFPDLSDAKRFPASAGPVSDPAASAGWKAMSEEDQDTINRIFSNMGKSIAAYERLLMPRPTRFDAYIDATLAGNLDEMKKQLTEAEAQGLQLFVGSAHCINCHNGPLLTNHSFHNTGVAPATDLPPDFGRREGVMTVMDDPFNCTGKYSDAGEDQCQHVRFARKEGLELLSAFKVPTLRNVAQTAPYMHSGQIATLTDVLNHYNVAALAVRGHSEASPLNLSPVDLQNLEAFLRTLSGPLATAPEFLAPPADLVQTESVKK